jgi:hypothetical protein
MMLKTVFVHLGPGPAPHLWRNVSRFNALFPGRKATIILSDIRHKKHIDLTKNELFIYKTSSDTESQLRKLSTDVKFREGFWRYSIERFYAIRDFHELDQVTPILHLESDVVVLPNFPFDEFKSIKHLAWEKFNSSHDVSAILYSNCYGDSKWLVERINEALTADTKSTDMTALSQISNSNLSRVEILPTDPTSNTSNQFGGIFDAAAIGMWLNGRDPRNHLGFIKRFLPLPESSVNASKLDYRVNRDGCLQVMNQGGVTLQLFNLHVHAKRRSLMSKHWAKFLFIDVFTAKHKIMSQWFSPLAFASICKNYTERNGLNFRKIVDTLLTIIRGKSAN